MKTEAEMREAKVPSLRTIEGLKDYIQGLVDMEHDYGTCVYAMSMSAVAAFNYVAGQLGVTGFQASCADLDIIRRTRHWEYPFIILNANDCLYPQYDNVGKLLEAQDSWKEWLGEQAKKKLEDLENGSFGAHPDVVAHWRKLADDVKPIKELMEND